ncbi:MAG: methyltransferase domain-containing protein [Desulfamplus sp.]|nr:methyltransferase domain-containing protein [Desulfamplus sp.]MBF0412451.1 methyltransferase domain-containing protein [Desulfamplus sp.]
MQDYIKSHYGSDDLGAKIFAALARAGKQIDNLELKDLSIIDQLHTGGHIATLELAKKAGISHGDIILDAGCGIGGSSRLLARTFECKVTGIDLVPSFIDVAKQLAESTKTADQVSFLSGDVKDTGLLDDTFDVIWCQHTLMNIRNKPSVFQEFKRILKPNGIMVLHEIVQGNTLDIHLPVPWAAHPAISFLIPQQEMEQMILDSGFTCRFIEDRTDQAKLWWDKVNAASLKNADSSHIHLGPHIIFGDNGRLFGQTMSSNINEGRIRLIEAVYHG